MNGALSCPGFKWSLLPNEYFMHFWALCLQSNFFVPSNFEKCLETVPCKGIYSVIILFTGMDTSSSFLLSHSASKKLLNVYAPHIFDSQLLENLITNNRFEQSYFFLSFSENSRSPNKKPNSIQELARRKYLVHTGNESLIC